MENLQISGISMPLIQNNVFLSALYSVNCPNIQAESAKF